MAKNSRWKQLILAYGQYAGKRKQLRMELCLIEMGQVVLGAA